MNIRELKECPECNVSWIGDDMFKIFRKQEWCKYKSDEELQKYIESSYKEPYNFVKLIGIEVPEKYDGVSYWMCPECKTKWDRWTGDKVD